MLRAARPTGAGSLVPGLPSLRTLVDVGPVTAPTAHAAEGLLNWSEFVGLGGSVSTADVDERIRAVRPEDVCDLMFTSGTTGRPKGVPATHEQSLRAFATWSEVA